MDEWWNIPVTAWISTRLYAADMLLPADSSANVSNKLTLLPGWAGSDPICLISRLCRMLLLAIHTLTSPIISERRGKGLDRLIKYVVCEEQRKQPASVQLVSDVLANQKSAHSETLSLLSRQREATKRSLVTPRFFPVGYFHLLWLPTNTYRHLPKPADTCRRSQQAAALRFEYADLLFHVSCLRSFLSILLIMFRLLFWLLWSGLCLVVMHWVAQPDPEENINKTLV